MPTRREDIRQHDVIALFLLGVFGKNKAVVIAVRHAEKFGLSARYGPMSANP